MSRSPSLFSNLPRDGSSAIIQAANAIVTQDATGTPQTSPLAYTSAVITLAVPTNALELVILPSTALRISEISTIARYFVVPANTVMDIPVGNTASFYIKEDSADGTLQFYFITV